MGVLSTILQTGGRLLFGAGRQAVSQTGQRLLPGATGEAARIAAAAARRAALLARGGQALPFALAGAGGAIVGGTLLDDIGPDLASQLMEAGIDPTQFRRKRVKGPDIVVDPVTGARFRRIKKRRARGITAVELRGFNRVSELLFTVGRVPRKLDHGSSHGKKKKK